MGEDENTGLVPSADLQSLGILYSCRAAASNFARSYTQNNGYRFLQAGISLGRKKILLFPENTGYESVNIV